jgi:hypothetical protein|tara:strand:+ start:106 stop:375 length:270 start_codon:yes stop_codon:yes gene_type:complete
LLRWQKLKNNGKSTPNESNHNQKWGWNSISLNKSIAGFRSLEQQLIAINFTVINSCSSYKNSKVVLDNVIGKGNRKATQRHPFHFSFSK